MSTSTTTRSRGKHGDLYPLDQYLVTMHRSAAGTIWRWRAELAIVASLVAFFCWLAGQVTIIWAGVVLAAFLAVLLGVPHSRRFITRRAWCVITRHRFHRLCWEARLHTRSGRLPAILWTRPTNVGERLTVWCRAGICAEDFEKSTGEISAACYAREARVTRNPRWSQVVTIDIIRRDTLAASNTIPSALARLARHYPDAPGYPATDEGNGPAPWPGPASTDPVPAPSGTGTAPLVVPGEVISTTPR